MATLKRGIASNIRPSGHLMVPDPCLMLQDRNCARQHCWLGSAFGRDLSLVHLVLYPIAVELPAIGPHISACRYRFANESVHLSAPRLVGRESALCLHRACHCWWSFPEQVYPLWIQISSRITVSFLILSAGLEPRTCSPHPTWICHDHVSWQKDWLQTLFAEFWWRRQKTRSFFFCGPTILERAGEDWSISPPLDALTILAGRDTQECVRVLSES